MATAVIKETLPSVFSCANRVSNERCMWHQKADMFYFDGVIIGSSETLNYHLSYELHFDLQMQLNLAVIAAAAEGSSAQGCVVTIGYGGGWYDRESCFLKSLSNCRLIHFSGSVVSHLTALKYLELRAFSSSELEVAVYDVRKNKLRPGHHRYTRLEKSDQGALFLFESLDEEIMEKIQIDSSGNIRQIGDRVIWNRPKG